jgi:hypothetical protein
MSRSVAHHNFSKEVNLKALVLFIKQISGFVLSINAFNKYVHLFESNRVKQRLTRVQSRECFQNAIGLGLGLRLR